jgi:uncharacterized protein YkwD
MNWQSRILLASLLSLTCALGCSSGKSSGSSAITAASTGTNPGATTSSAATTSNPAPGGTATPPPTGNVGSPYWYEGDAYGNPFKTHDAAEATFAQQILVLVNQERAAAGVPPLQSDAQAELAAKAHTEDMEGRGFFSHFTPEGWSPLDRLNMTGASGFSINGENIAVGQRDAAAVMQAWMNSPGHRDNMLLPDWTHLGVGVTLGSSYWAQVFLRRP